MLRLSRIVGGCLVVAQGPQNNDEFRAQDSTARYRAFLRGVCLALGLVHAWIDLPESGTCAHRGDLGRRWRFAGAIWCFGLSQSQNDT